MRRGAYIRQLKRDIEFWIAQNVITPHQADQMLQLAAQGAPTRPSVPAILTMLGAVLLAFAGMTYVAANWQGLGKLERLLILGTTMVAAYGAAGWLFVRARSNYAQAAVLLGCALFGANIMLLGQTYHMSAHWPNGILLWAVGVSAAALIIPSKPALALTILLFGLWTFGETLEADSPHLLYLIPFALMCAVGWVWKWRPSLHLLTLSFLIWLAINLAFFVANKDWDETHLFTLYVLAATALLSATMIKETFFFQTAGQRYGFFAIFFSYFLLQLSGGASESETAWLLVAGVLASVCAVAIVLALVSDNIRLLDAGILMLVVISAIAAPYIVDSTGALSRYVYAALYIGLAVWAVDFGLEKDDAFIVNLAFTAFGAEVLWLYFSTFSTLLNQAIFFAIGGIILIASAVVLERVRRQLLANDTQGD